MSIAQILMVSWLAVGGPPAAKQGVITGTVVNASRGKTPEADSEVVLRVRLSGQFVPFDQTRTDARGRFRFLRVPVGESFVYRPGANRDGVHYPGPAVELTSERPSASVELAVCDSVAEPCPLVIRRQEITVRHEPGVLQVTESILVDNPSATCYAGRTGEDGSPPITLQLAIPPEFSRTPFQEEFYGRRFGIAGGKLVTGIPWPPGQRELKFTYVIPTNSPSYRWQRPLDLPCDNLRVRIENAKPNEIACSLQESPDENAGTVAFGSGGEALPAGHVVYVDLGQLPMPLMAYAKWLALAVLGILAVGAGIFLVCRHRRAGSSAIATIPLHAAQPDAHCQHVQGKKRKNSRRAA